MNEQTGAYYEGTEVAEAQERGEVLTALPYKPQQGCRCCKSRGTKRSWGTTWLFGACPKCYPDHPRKSVLFAQYLRNTMIRFPKVKSKTVTV